MEWYDGNGFHKELEKNSCLLDFNSDHTIHADCMQRIEILKSIDLGTEQSSIDPEPGNPVAMISNKSCSRGINEDSLTDYSNQIGPVDWNYSSGTAAHSDSAGHLDRLIEVDWLSGIHSDYILKKNSWTIARWKAGDLDFMPFLNDFDVILLQEIWHGSIYS